MKYFSAISKVSMNGPWIFFLILVIALVIVVLWQLRQNSKHSRQITELYSHITTLQQWYGTQGENIEFLKSRLSSSYPSGMPNAAHAPDVERAVKTVMASHVVRLEEAYDIIYRAIARGKAPEPFAEKFVEMLQKYPATPRKTGLCPLPARHPE